MPSKDFDIQILDLHWIPDTDEPNDLCAHGHVFVRIGDEIIADKDSLDVTLSSTALYLMRTIEENYEIGGYGSQLLPCCGHFFVADEKDDFVTICGCPNGIDWTIIHTKDSKIKHIAQSGQEAIIDKTTYEQLVFDFADQVEAFYKKSLPKVLPTEELVQKGYKAFWREWQVLRNKKR